MTLGLSIQEVKFPAGTAVFRQHCHLAPHDIGILAISMETEDLHFESELFDTWVASEGNQSRGCDLKVCN